MAIDPRICLIVLLLAAGCSHQASQETAPPAEAVGAAKEQAEKITAGAASNPICALFTQAEIEQALGTPVGAGESAGPMGTACQWNGTKDENAYVQIQKIDDTKYWNPPTRATGFEKLSGIAKDAYVVPELGGFAAGALADKSLIIVSMTGGTTNRDAAVKLLKTVLERLEQ